MEHCAFNLLLTLSQSCPHVCQRGIIALLTLTSSWTSRGGREGKTFNQNAELLPKGPVNKCAWNLAKSSRWWAEKGQLDYWPVPDGGPKWGVEACNKSQLTVPFPTQEPKVVYRSMTWSSRTTWPRTPMQKAQKNGIYPVGWIKRIPSESSNLGKKQWDITNSESEMIPIGPGPKLTLPSFCLCRQFCLTRIPTICFREKLFLKAFPELQKHSSNYRH